jgi:hypothetical protein
MQVEFVANLGSVFGMVSLLLITIYRKMGGFMKRYIGILFFACFAHAALAAPELRGTPDQLMEYLADAPGRVVIQGMGEVKAAADEANIVFVVKSTDDSFQTALQKNKALRVEVVDYLKAQGISNDKITSEKFSSTPVYGVFGSKPKSYEVVNKISVKVSSEKEFEMVSTVVDKWRDVAYAKTTVKHSEEDVLKRTATRKALEDAMTKKKDYEESLNVVLVPHNITETKAEPVVADQMRMSKYGSGSFSESPMMSFSSVGSDSITATEGGASTFGELVYKANVNIEFVVKKK